MNQTRFEEGALAEGDLLKVKLERVKFDTAVTQAQLAVRQATIKLLALLDAEDLDSATPVAGELTFTPAPLNLNALRAQALQNATALQVAERSVGLAERRIGLEEARAATELTPFFGYKRLGPDNTILFGVSVPLPLFDRNQGGIARARAEAGVARTEMMQARTRILADVESAFRAWESARIARSSSSANSSASRRVARDCAGRVPGRRGRAPGRAGGGTDENGHPPPISRGALRLPGQPRAPGRHDGTDAQP